jgi:hypothetical protein
MERRSVEAIVQALNEAGVRYLIVGGLAVVAHGFVRFTADIDVVLDPDPESMRRAVTALAGLGYKPRAPVEFAEFADPEARARWAREKGLTVFSAFSTDHSATEIDLFIEAPFDFDRAYANAAKLEVAPGRLATFVGLADLMDMKRKVGRPSDLQDIRDLQSLQPKSEERS